MVNDGVAFAIELGGQDLFGQGHTDGVGNTLTQWTRRRFYAHVGLVLGMARGAMTELTEIPELVYRHVVTGQVQQAV